jgi:hypothetical protein
LADVPTQEQASKLLNVGERTISRGMLSAKQDGENAAHHQSAI